MTNPQSQGEGQPLPCPFCGSRNVSVRRQYVSDLHWADCGGCHANGPSKMGEAEAIAAWNQRSSSPGVVVEEADIPEIAARGARGEALTPVEKAAWAGFELGWRDGHNDASPRAAGKWDPQCSACAARFSTRWEKEVHEREAHGLTASLGVSGEDHSPLGAKKDAPSCGSPAGCQPSAVWRPIAEAPIDGTVIWGFLHDSGIRLVRWMGPEECAASEGSSDPEDYEGVWCEALDDSEDWSPAWWASLEDIPIPTAWVKAARVIAAQNKARGGKQSEAEPQQKDGVQ